MCSLFPSPCSPEGFASGASAACCTTSYRILHGSRDLVMEEAVTINHPSPAVGHMTWPCTWGHSQGQSTICYVDQTYALHLAHGARMLGTTALKLLLVFPIFVLSFFLWRIDYATTSLHCTTYICFESLPIKEMICPALKSYIKHIMPSLIH